MTTNKIFAYLGLSLLATLSGCATAPPQTTSTCPPTDSKALCLLKMAEIAIGIRDSKSAPIAENADPLIQSSKSKSSFAENATLATVPFAIGGSGLTPRMSSLSSGLLLGFAFSSMNGHANLHNLFVVMPKSKIIDSDPVKTVEFALISALEKGLGFNVDRNPVNRKIDGMFHKANVRKYKFTGGDCETEPCLLHFQFSEYDSNKTYKPIIIDSPPSWVSNEQVYIFLNP